MKTNKPDCSTVTHKELELVTKTGIDLVTNWAYGLTSGGVARLRRQN